MLVLPITTAPASSSLITASEEKVGTKFDKILDEHVVSISLVHMLSLIATGTPAKGPVSLPDLMSSSAFLALARAASLSTVTYALISDSELSICLRTASTN